MEEINIKKTNLVSHQIEITDRSNTKITGVKKLESFDEKHFMVETIMGFLDVFGTGLTLGRMDTDNGILTINGTIDSLKYLGKSKSPDKESLLKKLFK